MKTLFSLCIVLSMFSKIDAQIHQDKVLHFYAGAIISAGTTELMYQLTDNKYKAVMIGFGTGIVAGATKEIYDKTSGKGYSDPRDFLWTCAGASLSCFKLTIKI